MAKKVISEKLLDRETALGNIERATNLLRQVAKDSAMDALSITERNTVIHCINRLQIL